MGAQIPERQSSSAASEGMLRVDQQNSCPASDTSLNPFDEDLDDLEEIAHGSCSRSVPLNCRADCREPNVGLPTPALPQAPLAPISLGSTPRVHHEQQAGTQAWRQSVEVHGGTPTTPDDSIAEAFETNPFDDDIARIDSTCMPSDGACADHCQIGSRASSMALTETSACIRIAKGYPPQEKQTRQDQPIIVSDATGFLTAKVWDGCCQSKAHPSNQAFWDSMSFHNCTLGKAVVVSQNETSQPLAPYKGMSSASV